MERWTRLVIRYRWLVASLWALVLLGSLVAVRDVSKLLTNRFSIPGSETARAEAILQEHFDQRSDGTFQLVFVARPSSSAAESLAAVGAAARRAAAAVESGRVASVGAVSDRIAAAVVTSNLEPADAKNYTDDVREAAGTLPGGRLYVTGTPAVTSDLDPVFAHDVAIGELIALPIAFLILVFVFGTLAFCLPLLFAVAAIPATLGIVWIIAHFM